jgi:alkylhydroperoxidase/carboxymuconolactone decarboxylase family protein YurZ
VAAISQDDELKAYKAAKSPQAMVESWGLIQGGKADVFHKLYGVYEEKAPHLDIIKTFVHQPEIEMMERRILDPKSKELARLALALDSADTALVTLQVVAAKQRGATDEEIMDTVYLTAYSARKNAVAKLGQALHNGFKMAEEMKIKEKLEAAKRAGKDCIVDPTEETEAMKAAKTQKEMVVSWSVKLGMNMEQGLKMWDEGKGRYAFLKVWDELAPHLNIIKDFWHDPEMKWMERCLEGHAVSLKNEELIWWVLIAKQQNLDALAYHVACNLCRGMTEEETLELFYLLSIEVGKTFLGKVGPALAEGFKQASELGL